MSMPTSIVVVQLSTSIGGRLSSGTSWNRSSYSSTLLKALSSGWPVSCAECSAAESRTARARAHRRRAAPAADRSRCARRGSRGRPRRRRRGTPGKRRPAPPDGCARSHGSAASRRRAADSGSDPGAAGSRGRSRSASRSCVAYDVLEPARSPRSTLAVSSPRTCARYCSKRLGSTCVDALRVDALTGWAQPSPSSRSLGAVGRKRASLEVQPKPRAEQRLLRVGVETDVREVVEDVTPCPDPPRPLRARARAASSSGPSAR